jgi:hypothetical protein
MTESDQNKIREYYYAATEIKKVIEDGTKQSGVIHDGPILEYERLLAEAQTDAPGLLKTFNRQDYFSHSPGRGNGYYHADGVKAHIARNIAILKVRVDDASQTPVTETRSFHFVADGEIRKILERDYLEVQKNVLTSSWKSAMLLSGGSIEAILLDLLHKDEATTKSSSKAPAETNLDKWHLNDLIEVAVETKLVSSAVAKLSHSVREYRNLIHPGVEIRGNLKVEPEEAKIAAEVLNILIRELS